MGNLNLVSNTSDNSPISLVCDCNRVYESNDPQSLSCPWCKFRNEWRNGGHVGFVMCSSCYKIEKYMGSHRCQPKKV